MKKKRKIIFVGVALVACFWVLVNKATNITSAQTEQQTTYPGRTITWGEMPRSTQPSSPGFLFAFLGEYPAQMEKIEEDIDKLKVACETETRVLLLGGVKVYPHSREKSEVCEKLDTAQRRLRRAEREFIARTCGGGR